jgi:ubiquinone/menaquinone biosynthesis C-methylase UbiE
VAISASSTRPPSTSSADLIAHTPTAVSYDRRGRAEPGPATCQTPRVPPRRDLAAFEARAPGYAAGWLGHLHHVIADRTSDLALSAHPRPRRVIDVGCGTGYLLRSLAARCPEADSLVGIDPAPAMVAAATAGAQDDRLNFTAGVAERLAFPDGSFDLVVSTTSFDHWSDQLAGLRESARVLVPGGHLVLVDQFSGWLVPTLLVGRRGKARTKRRCAHLVEQAGFSSPGWHDVYSVIIKAAVATA